MGRVTGYAFGGIGISVDACKTVVDACERADGRVTIGGEADVRTIDQVRLALERLKAQGDVGGVNVEIQSTPPSHCGFGSKTSLLLSALEAASLAAGLSLTKGELTVLSGRGGASGVGVNSYFAGGVVWDYGHPNDEVDELLPSSLRDPDNPPLNAGGVCFPNNWRILLALPDGENVSGPSEAEFFRASTPIPIMETLNVIASVHHGVIPAVLSARLPDLKYALDTIQSVGMKRLEITRQPKSATLLEELRRIGFACGMSSLGPLVYAVIDKLDAEGERLFAATCAQMSTTYLGCHRSGNGREITRG